MAFTKDLVDPAHTAIVLNECQRGIVGDMAVFTQLVEAAAPALVGIGKLVRSGRPAGVQVVHCVGRGRADGRGGGRNSRMFVLTQRRRAAGEGTPFDPVAYSQIPDEIGQDPADIVLARSHGMSPMCDTGLDPLLRNLGVTTLVIGGVSLNVGVTNLAMDATNRGYDVVVPRDCCAGIPASYGEAVLEHTLANLAWITTSDELCALWAGGA